MPSPLEFASLAVRHSVTWQSLSRTPEVSQLTDSDDNVVQYDRVMGTKLAVAYAAGLEVFYCAQDLRESTNALDLACGPGHFTLSLARYLGCDQVTGIDLSPPMVATAQRNAIRQGVGDRVSFKAGDATCLAQFDDQSVDLCSFTDAAHHMPDLSTVTDVLREMERVTRDDGTIMVMDLVRLATAPVTERYIQVLAHDYIARGLPRFYDDFRNSMYAAWTADELRQALPQDSQRVWCHIVPRGLPTIQFLLGLPLGRRRPFVRSGWSAAKHPLVREWYPRWEQEIGQQWARETLMELRLLKLSLRFASRTFIYPRSASVRASLAKQTV